MAGQFEVRPGLDAIVARMIAGKIEDIAGQVEQEARRLAPGVNTWVTDVDESTRPEHAKAHGQQVPDNLRFVLDSPRYDQEHYHAGPRQQLRRPRDPAGTPGLTENCRCETVHDGQGLARHIHAGPMNVAGTSVSAAVTSSGPRVADAEFGSDDDPAARFMGRALDAVAARLRRRTG